VLRLYPGHYLCAAAHPGMDRYLATILFGQSDIEGTGDVATPEHPGGRHRLYEALAHPGQSPAKGSNGAANSSYSGPLLVGVLSRRFRHLIPEAGCQRSERHEPDTQAGGRE
jgi:hypothetical protein